MNNQDKIDLKVIFTFTSAYEDLYEKGEITADQLNRVLSLIDRYQDYSPTEFKEKLRNIFPK
ncbi:MAG TPA: hypothetical protein VJ958_03815 [Atribacterota bacterium]|nr:hypothetical protein [Atribacterota bacterium]